MQILRVGPPSLSYNIPHLNSETKFYLDGKEYHPAVRDWTTSSFIQIPPAKNKFDELVWEEGILLYIDEEVASSTETRMPRVDENGVPIPSDVKTIESGLQNKLARFQKYLDFKNGYKEAKFIGEEEVIGPISKKDEKNVTTKQVPYSWEDFLLEVFNVKDTELWLHQEKKATKSQLDPEKPDAKNQGLTISRIL